MNFESSDIFTRITEVSVPKSVPGNKGGRSAAFEIKFKADGEIPFPQVILRENGMEHLFKGDLIQKGKNNEYSVKVPEKKLSPGKHSVQIEGCRSSDWQSAGGGDWIKEFSEIRVEREKSGSKPHVRVGAQKGVKLYFGIHKHMHQPYYRAADLSYWDGEKEGIFGSRQGAYTTFISEAVRQYIDGGLAHAGLSTSWSGSLIEQLNRCEKEGLCGGVFKSWSDSLKEIAKEQTSLNHKRVAFTAFGFYHPLMALIPGRNMLSQIEMHRDIIKNTFGVDPSPVMFPPETAFHVRMIPWLKEAGVRAVIYDSIHRYRACKEYPYPGIEEGMLPPNRADQENPPVDDWIPLNNIWAPGKISPSLLRPEYVKYEDVDGTIHKIIGVPAERYIGNEDARGGFGALQYEDVLSQLYNTVVDSGNFDPKHPPFFVLHSDGDNHGGGADSYYRHNTARLVEWVREDERFELTTIEDYLDNFPPDPANAVHVEGGSWAGADNGDPQFKKWFSMYDQPYSPDLNSWAVLTAFQNCVHTVEDQGKGDDALKEAKKLMLTAETSCYWYWTGQELWDRQVTEAANKGYALIKGGLDKVISSGKDKTAPAIFTPWITPENPGGKAWGQGCLIDAPQRGTVHTFVYDISGIEDVKLVIRSGKEEKQYPMKNNGPYKSNTGPAVTSVYYTAELPEGLGDVRYYIVAKDKSGNTATSSLERIFLP
ncbi:alpha-amylase [Chitinispirillum alkaliphilum]|nr:alpha-amylase [Chitinispirillum alkaliphilum]